MSQWQPIETAPKDGTHVLAYWELSSNVIAVVMKDFDEWVDPFSGEICQIIPTHWMPLPTPPNSEQSDSAEITLFKKPNDPNERVNKPNYNPPSFEDFDK